MLSFSHQASDAIGALIAEFTLQFRTYETKIVKVGLLIRTSLSRH